MTKHYITPEEHARLQRRRGRQALGLLITILVLVGFVTVLRAGVGLVANLFDDTAQKQGDPGCRKQHKNQGVAKLCPDAHNQTPRWCFPQLIFPIMALPHLHFRCR